MQKIAIFDFCETLVNFQTADAYVDFVRKQSGSKYMKLLNIGLAFLSKIKAELIFNKFLPKAGVFKKLKLAQLQGIHHSVLDGYAAEFYTQCIKPNFIYSVVDEMIQLQNNGYQVVVCSAGYSVYIKYFTAEFKIQHLIATEIDFDKSGVKCLGKIKGLDCISGEKVNRIRSYFNYNGSKMGDSISYSDSITDLPMMQLTEKGVVVSESKSQQWSKQNNFSEIIWIRK